MYLVKGLGNTLLITIVAVVVGILLGFLLAYIRTTHDKTGNWKIANLIAHGAAAPYRVLCDLCIR